MYIYIHIYIDDKDDEQMDSDSSESNLDPTAHKKSLMKLKDTDPEFYEYLKENDKNLLDFRVSDDEDDDNSSINDNRHIPNKNLEVRIFYINIFNSYIYFQTIFIGC